MFTVAVRDMDQPGWLDVVALVSILNKPMEGKGVLSDTAVLSSSEQDWGEVT